MMASEMSRFGFRIRTKVGVVVDNLVIHGRDELDAQRKLRQMYLQCEILECKCQPGGATRFSVPSFEEVAGLITR